jgi:hypothetical protein
MQALQWYLKKLDSSPVPTKTVTSAIIVGTGQVASQYIAQGKLFNKRAAGVYYLWGTILAPFNHHWQNFINTWGAKSLNMVVKKPNAFTVSRSGGPRPSLARPC